MLRVYIYGLPAENAKDGKLAYIISGDNAPILRGNCGDIASLILDLHILSLLMVNPIYNPPHESLHKEPGAFVLDDRVIREIEATRTMQRTPF